MRLCRFLIKLRNLQFQIQLLHGIGMTIQIPRLPMGILPIFSKRIHREVIEYTLPVLLQKMKITMLLKPLH